jgi:uncharacterized membrane protein
MLRRALVEKAPEVVDGFRMRGTEVSRLEAFVDCVFGFGLTLIVVSSQAPQKYDDLLTNLRSFVPFGLCFAIFFSVWSRHYNFCRRFGLEDGWVRALTVTLLFVMLIYLYPLRFLAMVFATYVLGVDVGWRVQKGEHFDLAQLFIIYGVGFAAIQLLFALLYYHAYRQHEELRLDELERLDTKWWTIEQAGYLLVPLLSIALALVLPAQAMGLAGFAYFGMGIVGWIHGSMHGRRHREVVERMEAAGRLSAAELNTENDLLEVTSP